MDTSNLIAEKDFLFVIQVKSDVYYKNQAELTNFLKVLPPAIRLYAVIHAGMNTLKVYCITKSFQDYTTVHEKTGFKTEIIDTRKISQDNDNATGLN
ncbi:MAG TPA: hypothetical protein VGB50_10625 [Flavobacterium sp.]|jgi:hypothetical protein